MAARDAVLSPQRVCVHTHTACMDTHICVQSQTQAQAGRRVAREQP